MTMWKQLIATFLLFGILTNCFSFWLVSSSYALNKEYISTVLCTNKDNHELHCEGKCFMDIKLKELEQKSKSDQENLKRMVETVTPQTSSLIAPVFEVLTKEFSVYYLQQKPIKNTIAIFHPPQLG